MPFPVRVLVALQDANPMIKWNITIGLNEFDQLARCYEYFGIAKNLPIEVDDTCKFFKILNFYVFWGITCEIL